jgi:hypothetical protein
MDVISLNAEVVSIAPRPVSGPASPVAAALSRNCTDATFAHAKMAWQVTIAQCATSDAQGTGVQHTEYDAVMVCNGHYAAQAAPRRGYRCVPWKV